MEITQHCIICNEEIIKNGAYKYKYCSPYCREIGNKQNRKKTTKEQARKQYNKYKERYKTNAKEQYNKNKDKLEYKQRKKEYNQKYFIDKYHNDKQYNIRVRLCNCFNRAMERYNKKGYIPPKKDKKIDYNAIIEHLQPFPKDFEMYEIDHIIPLAAFDLTNPIHLKLSWDKENIQLLLKDSNRVKSDTINFILYPEQEEVYNNLNLKDIINLK